MVSRRGWCCPRGVAASSETNGPMETLLPKKKGCQKVEFQAERVFSLVKA